MRIKLLLMAAIVTAGSRDDQKQQRKLLDLMGEGRRIHKPQGTEFLSMSLLVYYIVYILYTFKNTSDIIDVLVLLGRPDIFWNSSSESKSCLVCSRCMKTVPYCVGLILSKKL